LVVARVSGKRTGELLGLNGGSLAAISAGVILIAFAVFASIRGTISNNLWWIFAVTIFSTGAGLAIAVMSDRSKGESVAKSFIFMPMAISFVGAGIIWRFMFIARPPA
jgi:alpha-glucoside transport system permease protein